MKKIRSLGFLIFLIFFAYSAHSEEFYGREICSYDFYAKNKFHLCEKMCEFKFNDKKNYSFCGKKIRKIAFSIELGSYYRLSYHLPLVKKSLRESLQKIDAEVGEYKYKVIELPLGNRDIPIGTDYFFYVHIENPNFDNGTVRVNILKSMNGKFDFGFDYMPVNVSNFENLFVENLEVISNQINFELLYKKDGAL